MKTPEQRINILIGQLESIKTKLNDKKTECGALMIQLKAVKSGLSSLMEEVLSSEFECCLKSGQKEKIKNIFKEIIK